MLVIAGLMFGALGGAWFARRKGGAGFDIAQYAAGLGIFFGILGLFATLILDRLI
ncbi:hypothetical protein ACFOHK_11210 [Falsigemmobacter intermedius]|uniref:hypothetical protein n=1 Tax=Falsigemmobacter intermedius TaxID=1553448 RepID=UPI0013E401C0|nr:hypothetical protein [Falsigemmobacter intermedius]